MGVLACAELLRVSERTIRGWESGATRIPYAAYKLLRVLKGGRYLAHPTWKDFIIRGDVLITPEGHQFQAGELSWWSLLVRQARAFREVLVREQAHLSACSGRVSARKTLGLSYYSTSGNKGTDNAPLPRSISALRDTLRSAGVASAGLAPGAVIPVGGQLPTHGSPPALPALVRGGASAAPSGAPPVVAALVGGGSCPR